MTNKELIVLAKKLQKELAKRHDELIASDGNEDEIDNVGLAIEHANEVVDSLECNE